MASFIDMNEDDNPDLEQTEPLFLWNNPLAFGNTYMMNSNGLGADQPGENRRDTNHIPYGARSTLLRRFIVVCSGLSPIRTAPIQYQIIFTLTEVISLLLVLVLTRGENCDSPLRTFLLMYISKESIALPANIYLAKYPMTFVRGSTTDEVIHDMDHHAERYLEISMMLNFFVLLYGNMSVFSCETCQYQSPLLYYAALITLLGGWLLSSQVLVLVALLIIFLPVILIFSRVFNWDIIPRTAPTNQPLSEDQLRKIPLVVYVPEGEASKGTFDPTTPQVFEEVEGATYANHDHGADSRDDHLENRQNKKMWNHWIFHPSMWKQRFNRASSSYDIPDEEQSLLPRDTLSDRNHSIIMLDETSSPSSNYGGVDNSGDQQVSKLKRPHNEEIINGNDGREVKYATCVYPHHVIPDSQNTCAICLQDFEAPPLEGSPEVERVKPEPLRKLPCGHCLHRECVDAWLILNGKCPTCSRSIEN